MLPQIDNQMYSETTVIEIPSKTYKLNLGVTNSASNHQNIEVDRIIGFVDKKEAIKQAVYHILSVERYAYLIYDENYGVELEQYIGKDISYIRNTIQQTLQEALTHDLRIQNVIVTQINEISPEAVEIKFIVESIYGDLQMEVNINV